MAKRARRSDRNHVVYKITDTITGEVYIGITVVRGRAFKKSMGIRWRSGHMSAAFCENRPYLFPQHIRQYAPEIEGTFDSVRDIPDALFKRMKGIFHKEVLEVVRGRDAAHKREVELIDQLQPALNSKKKSA